MNQNDMIGEVLDLYRDIESIQERINVLVRLNREAVKRDPSFERGYTESIESYFTNQ